MDDDVGDPVTARPDALVSLEAVVARAAILRLVVLAEIVEDELAPARRGLGVLEHHRELTLVVRLLRLIVCRFKTSFGLRLACSESLYFARVEATMNPAFFKRARMTLSLVSGSCEMRRRSVSETPSSCAPKKSSVA